jgi:hypothetical protein
MVSYKGLIFNINIFKLRIFWTAVRAYEGLTQEIFIVVYGLDP